MGYGEKGPAKGERPEGQPNKKYFLHLKHLGEYYGHKASKEIVEFCREQGLEYVTNDDSMSRPFDDPPIVVNYFYHERIRKSSKNGGA